MIKRVSWICVYLFCAIAGLAQGKKTTLSAQIYGYQHDMIYFDCVQTPLIRQEFYRNPGEEHVYSFETERPVNLLVNGRTEVLLLPGDSLHLDIHYEGKNIQSLAITGTPQAVANNELCQAIAKLKREMRYKNQLLTCVVLDTKPLTRLDDSRKLYAQVKEMLAKAGDTISPEVATYMLARVEADMYNSFMEYPMMYAETRKLPIEKQEIGDYWKLMDGFTPRKDQISLNCPEYVSLLMRYDFYVREKEAKAQGKTYQRPGTFEDMYKEFASFYTDETRDAVLYMLISNFVRGGKEIERVDPIFKDYKANYNQNKDYLHILDSLLQ